VGGRTYRTKVINEDIERFDIPPDRAPLYNIDDFDRLEGQDAVNAYVRRVLEIESRVTEMQMPERELAAKTIYKIGMNLAALTSKYQLRAAINGKVSSKTKNWLMLALQEGDARLCSLNYGIKEIIVTPELKFSTQSISTPMRIIEAWSRKDTPPHSTVLDRIAKAKGETWHNAARFPEQWDSEKRIRQAKLAIDLCLQAGDWSSQLEHNPLNRMPTCTYAMMPRLVQRHINGYKMRSMGVALRTLIRVSAEVMYIDRNRTIDDAVKSGVALMEMNLQDMLPESLREGNEGKAKDWMRLTDSAIALMTAVNARQLCELGRTRTQFNTMSWIDTKIASECAPNIPTAFPPSLLTVTPTKEPNSNQVRWMIHTMAYPVYVNETEVGVEAGEAVGMATTAPQTPYIVADRLQQAVRIYDYGTKEASLITPAAAPNTQTAMVCVERVSGGTLFTKLDVADLAQVPWGRRLYHRAARGSMIDRYMQETQVSDIRDRVTLAANQITRRWKDAFALQMSLRMALAAADEKRKEEPETTFMQAMSGVAMPPARRSIVEAAIWEGLKDDILKAAQSELDQLRDFYVERVKSAPEEFKPRVDVCNGPVEELWKRLSRSKIARKGGGILYNNDYFRYAAMCFPRPPGA
jgi:hypothetical protein